MIVIYDILIISSETDCRVGLMVCDRECGDCETHCRVGWANGVWSGMW